MCNKIYIYRDIVRYVQDVGAVKEMGQGLSDHHVVLCKVRLVGSWIKRREVMVGVRRIRSEKLREHQYREGYVRSLEGKKVQWDGDNNVEHMWEWVKWAMVESTRKVCGSVRVGGMNLKLQLGERRLLGRKCWQLVMKRQKKDVQKYREKKRERLKGVYIRAKGK